MQRTVGKWCSRGDIDDYGWESEYDEYQHSQDAYDDEDEEYEDSIDWEAVEKITPPVTKTSKENR